MVVGLCLATTKANLADKWELNLVKFKRGCTADQLAALSLKHRQCNDFDKLFALCQKVCGIGSMERTAIRTVGTKTTSWKLSSVSERHTVSHVSSRPALAGPWPSGQEPVPILFSNGKVEWIWESTEVQV
jgi:hypothetical protein